MSQKVKDNQNIYFADSAAISGKFFVAVKVKLMCSQVVFVSKLHQIVPRFIRLNEPEPPYGYTVVI